MILWAPVAQRIELGIPNPSAAGSIPARRTLFPALSNGRAVFDFRIFFIF